MPAKHAEKALVLQNTKISENIYKMVLFCTHKPAPGQFYMVRGWDRYPLLSRPISVHDADEKTVSFLYEVRGEGTKLLAQKRNGEEIELFGPLGSGFPTEKIAGKVAVVSGGIGIAPLLYLVKNLIGCEIHLFCGFREKSYETDAFKPFVKEIHVATDSGKQGHKGFVTDLFDPADFAMVLCCGPEVMMEKIARDAIKKQVPCLLSMERHMACGVGACLGCTVKTAGGAKCICKEGPVFWGEELYA